MLQRRDLLGTDLILLGPAGAVFVRKFCVGQTLQELLLSSERRRTKVSVSRNAIARWCESFGVRRGADGEEAR